jgi:hypothetical protein
MTKPTIRKVSASPAKSEEPSLKAVTSATASEAPATAAVEPAPAAVEPVKRARTGTPDWKLPAREKAMVKIGRLIAKGLKTEQSISGFKKEIATALENSRKWLETAKQEAESLAPDFKAPKGTTGNGADLKVGERVTLREKRRETYAGVLSPEEITSGVEIAGVHGSMVSVKTAKGVTFFPKAHVKPV